jgi:TldD protein
MIGQPGSLPIYTSTAAPLKTIQNTLLEPHDLTEAAIHGLLSMLQGPAIDWADLYFQSTESEYLALEEGAVKEAHYSVDQGVGLRAVSGEKTGYSYSDILALPQLKKAASAARGIARLGEEGRVCAAQSILPPQRYSPVSPLIGLNMDQKRDMLTAIDKAARAYDPRVVRVEASLVGSYELVLIVTHDGVWVPDVRPLVRLNIQVVAEERGRREQGSFGRGGRIPYQSFLQNNQHLLDAREAARQAIVNLSAVDAPAGVMPVILGPGWPGILLHEAVGHGLEGDFNRKGSSAFANRLGERVASSMCTVVDDGTLPDRRGSLNVDDEGTPTARTVLIENGILKGYMQDRLNARLMKHQPTGNGRRESYASMPMPRMTNTYLLPGATSPEEIIKTVDKGLYAVSFRGGQVDITSGQFVFAASEAYWIEKGQITHPVKGATLIGNGPDVMQRISMLGNDWALDTGIGTCGKEGQSVPVGVGQPTLKIDQITVGGTSHE